MTDLAEFLLARIAEDETAAREAQGPSRYGLVPAVDSAFEEAVDLAQGEGAREGALDHIARWNPARVLAECETRRRIVELHQPGHAGEAWTCDEDNYSWPCHTARLLALPYAGHPDYREEWRP